MSSDTATSVERYLREQAPPPPPYRLDTAHYSQIAAGERERRLRAEERARRWRTATLCLTSLALGIYGIKVLAVWAIGAALVVVVAAVWANVVETEGDGR